MDGCRLLWKAHLGRCGEAGRRISGPTNRGGLVVDVCSRWPEEGQPLHGLWSREVGRGKFILLHRCQLRAGLRSWEQSLGGKNMVMGVATVTAKAL